MNRAEQRRIPHGEFFFGPSMELPSPPEKFQEGNESDVDDIFDEDEFGHPILRQRRSSQQPLEATHISRRRRSKFISHNLQVQRRNFNNIRIFVSGQLLFTILYL